MNYDDACKMMGPNPRLRESNAKLKLYDGSYMKPLGVCSFYTSISGKENKLRFQVVKSSVAQKPLLSANTCETLGLISVNVETVHQVNNEITMDYINKHYSDVFTGLGYFAGEHKLDIDKSIKPVQHQPRRIPVALRDKVKEKIDEMTEQKIIEKVTTPTDWISSMVIVSKPEKLRICIDPKDLNKAIKRPRYQILTIEEILPRMKNAKIFSVLEAKDGYYHIKLDEESSLLTTFWTPFGRYKWLRFPFGISSGSEEYQRRQHEILEELTGIEVIADDILVCGCGDTEEEAIRDHDKNLIGLLERARKVNLKINKKKMRLKLKAIPYMGPILSSDGVKPDPEKVSAILDMNKPENRNETMTFLGCINYLAKFLPNLSNVVEPLRRLISKDSIWHWESEQENAFNEAKRLMSIQPVLRFYNADEEVTLQCDVSQKGMGATLLQNNQPVAFASRALSKTEQNYAQIEKECLSIVFA